MNDIPTLGSRRREDTRKSHRRLWLWTAISLVVLSAPAWADERPRATVIAGISPRVAPLSTSISVAALFGDRDAAVGQGELAAQRGGAFSVPIAQTSPAAQATPHVILWDELKSASPPPPAPAGQGGTNRINIQIR